MAWNATRSNQVLFSHGTIQYAPAEVLRLNAEAPREAPRVCQASYEAKPVNSGYTVLLTGYCSKIRASEAALGNQVTIERALTSLRSDVRSGAAKKLKGSVDTMSIEGVYYRIDYRIYSGQVLVFNIQPVDKVQKARDMKEKAALYKVKKNAHGTWELKGKIDRVTTGFAAVNAQSDNLAKAPWLMGAHLEFEFGKSAVNEFTLFHNPSVGGLGDTWESMQDKFGFTTAVTKKFAGLLVSVQENGQEVKWVVHSQGGLIFSKSVRYLLNGNSSSALNKLNFNGRTNKAKGTMLNKQSIAMHGNANNNVRSKALFERAGVQVIATRSNTYDVVNKIIGLNTANPWKILGSIVYANHVTGGSVQQSPHTLMHDGYKDWDNKMTNGPGKGRNLIQKGFSAIDNAGRNTVSALSNYLK